MCFPTLKVVLKLHQWKSTWGKKKRPWQFLCSISQLFSVHLEIHLLRNTMGSTYPKKFLKKVACMPELNNFVVFPSTQQFLFEIPMLDQSLSFNDIHPSTENLCKSTVRVHLLYMKPHIGKYLVLILLKFLCKHKNK